MVWLLFVTFTKTTFCLLLLSDPIVNNLVLSPVVDGDFLPDVPENLFHNAAEIDILAGTNDMDGRMYGSMDVPSVNDEVLETPM